MQNFDVLAFNWCRGLSHDHGLVCNHIFFSPRLNCEYFDLSIHFFKLDNTCTVEICYFSTFSTHKDLRCNWDTFGDVDVGEVEVQ